VNNQIVFGNVSKFYGDVLGVNGVNLSIPPGITSLVGPNGSGKTTLMNLMTGLIRPSRGHIRILDMTPDQPEPLLVSSRNHVDSPTRTPRSPHLRIN
jgi:ABC-2 type transport system ATP-binding protein